MTKSNKLMLAEQGRRRGDPKGHDYWTLTGLGFITVSVAIVCIYYLVNNSRDKTKEQNSHISTLQGRTNQLEQELRSRGIPVPLATSTTTSTVALRGNTTTTVRPRTSTTLQSTTTTSQPSPSTTTTTSTTSTTTPCRVNVAGVCI